MRTARLGKLLHRYSLVRVGDRLTARNRDNPLQGTRFAALARAALHLHRQRAATVTVLLREDRS